MCPLWLHWKQSPLWTLCRFSSSVNVAQALVRPISMVFGLRLLSAFLHWGFVAPPLHSVPLTLSLKNMYSCVCLVEPCFDGTPQVFFCVGYSYSGLVYEPLGLFFDPIVYEGSSDI